ncbi:MAG: TolC family protein [Gemmatimonadaceae bacterium]|nr:TolC family protein [Gemmatimonadaceae bacterium]
MRSLLFAALLALASQVVAAQPPAAPVAAGVLTLDEAIAAARRNNPLFLQTLNDRRLADAQVKNAQFSLLPSVSSSFGAEYNQGGDQFVGGAVISSSSNAISSSYNLGVNYSINGATLMAPRAARAQRDAVEADIEGTSEQLRAQVTQQYLTVLQAQARAAVQDTLVATAQTQLDLANARVAAGAATVLDIRRAEVGLGQAQVQALQARNAVAIERLRLFQQMGLEAPGSVTLVTEFPVREPSFRLDSLLQLARARHPALDAMRQRERASEVSVRQARSAYTPTLSLSTGWGGRSYQFTDDNYLVERSQAQLAGAQAQCFSSDSVRTALGLSSLNCTGPRYQFTPEMADQIRADNNAFPFGFNRSPFGVSARLSLPIFDNWSRELRVQQAQVQREDARYQVRARELQASSDVTQAYLTLVTAARTVTLQDQVARQAREELAFAEERYRVGAATFLDVTTSRSSYEQAQIDRINSVYDYHKAFAALENAVGRPLR